MSNKRKNVPGGGQGLRGALLDVEARLLAKVQAERLAREREGAADEEQFEESSLRIDVLKAEQDRWIERVRSIEKQLETSPRPRKGSKPS